MRKPNRDNSEQWVHQISVWNSSQYVTSYCNVMYIDSWLDLLTPQALKGKIFDRNVAGLLEATVVSNRQACSLLKNINLRRLKV